MLVQPLDDDAAGIGGATSYLTARGPVGIIVVAAGGLVCGLIIYAASRRNPITAHNVNDVPAPVPATVAA